MKDISKKNKIILALLILLIIVGAITLFIAGFNKSVQYRAGTRIEVYIPQGYERQDILSIAKESFNGKELAFEEVEKLNQVASIKLENYTEEELNSFKAKIIEKYEIKEDELEIYEIELPKTRISTLAEPYVFPVVLATALSLIYVLLRNLKSEDKWKKVLKVLISLIVTLAVYFSLILIIRVPFGTYTMPLALTIYIVTLLIIINKK